MSTMSAMALPELEGALHEFEAEGAAPVWRGAYALGEAEGDGETEAFFENLAEYAVGGGGGRGAGHAAGLGRIGSLAYRAAVGSTGGVPLATLGLDGQDGEYFDRESGLVRLSPLVVMEHFGHAMTEAESETEAEAFLPFLIPLAAKALPMLAKAVLPRLGSVVSRVAPRLMQSATRVMRTLRRNPRTRPLVRVMPTIVRRTMAGLARDVQQGQPVTPQRAVRRFAVDSRQVLTSPNACVEAYRRSRALDRRYHLICHRAPCW
jgi:hypothetical protein